MSHLQTNMNPIDELECEVTVDAHFAMCREHYQEFEDQLDELIKAYRI